MLKYKENNLTSSFKIEGEEDLKDKLNLKFMDLINKTICCGIYDVPKVLSPKHVSIDYLALFSDKYVYK